MKRNLTLLFWAANAVSCRALTVAAAPSRTAGEVFVDIPESSLFGACLQTVQLAEAPGISFVKACSDAFGKTGVQAASISTDCAELAGRASEAFDEHFLRDGRLMCGRLVRERAFATSHPLTAFAPAEGGVAASTFCDVMKMEALPSCAPAPVAVAPAPLAASAADASNVPVLPVVAVAPSQPQVTPALRATEAKPIIERLVATPSTVQSQPQLMVAKLPEPQMSEAAQTIAAGVWPAFARQVPQAMAAGLSNGLAAAPMNAKAEQQPDLNNGGIWTNLAALLHRTG